VITTRSRHSITPAIRPAYRSVNPLMKVSLTREPTHKFTEVVLSSWKGDGFSLLADERDSHVLVSAQACFLPIPNPDEPEPKRAFAVGRIVLGSVNDYTKFC
jgi:hypothetical protein